MNVNENCMMMMSCWWNDDDMDVMIMVMI